jgi:3-phenylpropionate/cinnamic acid dioxygenase small subunit
MDTDMSMYDLAADRQAIIDLTINYCWTIDSKDFENLRTIFLPEATALLGDERDGIESIIERIRGALGPLDASQHIISNHQIAITGDEATGRCYLHAQHVRRAAEGGPNYIVAGRYLDRYVRTPDGWRILRREIAVDWTDGNVRVARP